MKRNLIALAVAGLFANVAFAQPTLTGDDSYNDVHLTGWKGTPEITSYQVDTRRAMEIQEGIYSFNP